MFIFMNNNLMTHNMNDLTTLLKNVIFFAHIIKIAPLFHKRWLVQLVFVRGTDMRFKYLFDEIQIAFF